MTDPRIIECARAMRAAGWTPEAFTPAAWVTQQLEDFAKACVLKWLEQAPTSAMLNAAANQAPYGRAAYELMCAQAKKEITS